VPVKTIVIGHSARSNAGPMTGSFYLRLGLSKEETEFASAFFIK
jgi:hypothetical protein